MYMYVVYMIFIHLYKGHGTISQPRVPTLLSSHVAKQHWAPCLQFGCQRWRWRDVRPAPTHTMLHVIIVILSQCIAVHLICNMYIHIYIYKYVFAYITLQYVFFELLLVTSGLVQPKALQKPPSSVQYFWQAQTTRMLYRVFSRGHEMIPVWNPTSILKIALLSWILTVAHLK